MDGDEVWPRHTCHLIQTITDHLWKLDFKALSLLGINKHVRVQWRTIPRGFGGVGLYVEQTIGWIHMILQHYGVSNTLGKKCCMSLECLQLEIGCNGNPLHENYTTVGHLAMNSWWKAIMERSQTFSFQLLLDYPQMPPPWEHNCTFTAVKPLSHCVKSYLPL